MNIESLNKMTDDEAREKLIRCCGSHRWVAEMLQRRPFASVDALETAIRESEAVMLRADWLEAFAGHPRIGSIDGLREKYHATADWSEAEQSGVQQAAEGVLQLLADANCRYEERFGHIFIVCATGKSASEMLRLLSERMDNDPDTEFQIAAAEQAKITRLRLEKL
jgi:2-oxo-4-hydroxy-4-carboxy-5-ureidoimidazoline decarboxylase